MTSSEKIKEMIGEMKATGIKHRVVSLYFLECMLRLEEKAEQLKDADDRIFDMLLGDDGQAFTEAQKYLQRYRPDLANRITGEQK